jgi:ketosteroid isomerase-like protein
MPGGHIDTVRRACQAWCDGDISIYREMYAPDVVAEAGGLWPEDQGSVRGVEAVIGNFEALMRAFEHNELIPTRFFEKGDAMAVELVWRGVPGGSDAPVEQRLACTYRFRDGLITHTAWYAELGEALEAAGLGKLTRGSADVKGSGADETPAG